MRVFVTGASGFIGSAIVRELIDAGHQVLGLARSDASAAAVAGAGAEVLRGSLADPDSLRRGAASCDGVIHTAFIHDFNNYGPAAEADRRAIETMGAELAGSNRPLVVSSGTLLVQRRGALAEENDPTVPGFPRKSEEAAQELAKRGVHVSTVRLAPTVHGDGDHGFVPMLIQIARQKGVSAYVGDGQNRWPAVHRLDAAHLYRLAMEKGAAGANYHAIADEAIPTREIAEMIGRQLDVPVNSKSREDVAEHFGWIGDFFAIDGPASSEQTREQLGWQPNHVGLIEDLEHGTYFETATARR